MKTSGYIPVSDCRRHGAVEVAKVRRVTMKTLVATLVALTFLAGVVGPAIAAEPFSIKTLDQEGRGGHGQG
jgi:hypothetical protein